jgi:hypothetical protein
VDTVTAILQFLEGRFLSLFRIAASIMALSSFAGLFLRSTALLSLAEASKWLGLAPTSAWFAGAHIWLVSRAAVLDKTAIVIVVIGVCLAFKFPRAASFTWFGVGVCSELRDALPMWMLLGLALLLAIAATYDLVRARISDEYFESLSSGLLHPTYELFYAAFYLLIAPLRWLVANR